MSHLVIRMSRGWRDLLACAWEPVRPVERNVSAPGLRKVTLPEHVAFVGVTDCAALDWLVAAEVLWERHGLLVKQIAAPFAYLALFALLAFDVFAGMALWPKGVAR